MRSRVLVTGATGKLGAYLVRELVARGVDTFACGHSRAATVSGVAAQPVDLTDAAETARMLAQARPNVVIHAAAEANVSRCADHPDAAEAINAGATANLAAYCDQTAGRLVFVSTDLVFDGERSPYVETDAVRPLSVYGRTKVAGESTALRSVGNAVVRVSWMFGPALIPRENFFHQQVVALRTGSPVQLFDDEWRTPLSLLVAARALAGIALTDVSGLIHVGGSERMTRLEFGQRLAAYLGTPPAGIQATSRREATGEPRPRDVSLDSSRWRSAFPKHPWPTLEQALADMGVEPGG